jgi:V8-like Glu-specific endopeptidase
MKKISTLLILLSTAPFTHADIDVIYGRDNRLDVYQSSNAVHLKVAQSTAAMIPVSLFTKGAKEGVFDLQNTKSLERSQNICPTEKFADQPAVASCSGFLVAPDVIVTAGHCYKSFSTPENVCKSFAWVFDFKMTAAKSDPTKNISINNVYLCKQIIKAELTDKQDFAIIRLNRAVTGRTPLTLRKSGKIASSASITVIGNPSGIPTKISDGGKVKSNSPSTMFVTNLDTFHGNSGSAVVDSSTGVVEGILIQGKTDYVPSIPSNPRSCQVVNQCDENAQNCTSGTEPGPPGEMVLRISSILPFLK